jgi:RNA polymerase sigma factor for flagellar operon FliA
MLDEIRKGDWAPRSVHRNSRRIADAIRYIESSTGRDAQDQEVAAALDMTMDEYHHHLQDGAGSRLFSFEELLDQPGEREGELVNPNQTSPLEGISSDKFKGQLADAISKLPEREQLVLEF